MKRFVSMALALVMSLCLAVPAFAAEAVPDRAVEAVPTVVASGESIMPRTALLAQSLRATNTDETDSVTANADDGDYIRFYYRNDTDYKCHVYLIRMDDTSETIVGSMSVAGNAGKHEIYFRAGAGSATYKIKVENTENGGAVIGMAVLAQYHDLLDMPA